MTPHTVFACESQPIVVEGLERTFERCGEFRLVGAAPTPTAALNEVASLSPRIVLLDQAAGWRAVFHFVVELQRLPADTRAVLWVTEMTEADCHRALQTRVRGIVRKTLPVASLLECLRAVATGRVWMEGDADSEWERPGSRGARPRLTPRERDVVRLACSGLKNREIAERLSITAGTVKIHMMHVFEKTGLKDRAQLSVRARALLGDEPRTSGVRISA